MADEDKPKYPKGIKFIIANEYCERFCHFGSRAVLALYLTDILKLTEARATVIFHMFVFMVYGFPIVGAIISDSWLGKYKTIFLVCIIYTLGCGVLSVGAISSLGKVWSQSTVSVLGLTLIAIGSGGIKPCIAAFGGDQFVLPAQELQLSRFFAMFYFATNVGSVMATALTPILREKVHCLGEDTCYPLAFGVPGIMMVCATVVFVCGTPFYKIIEPKGNMFVKVSCCIGHAIKQKYKNRDVQKDHWLDYADDKYDLELINDIKIVLKVLVLFIPLPVFWTLYEQKGSGWTFQARRMSGEIGAVYTILPDQMQLANPIIVLILLPLFEYTLYPFMMKFNFGRPLQRMFCGGYLAAASFLVTGFISLRLESGLLEVPKPGYVQVRIYNTVDCELKVTASKLNGGVPFTVRSLDFWTQMKISLKGEEKSDLKVEGECLKASGDLELRENTAIGYYFVEKKAAKVIDDVEKHVRGLPKVRFLADYASEDWKAIMIHFRGGHGGKVICQVDNTSIFSIRPDVYRLSVGHHKKENLRLGLGGVYVVLMATTSQNHWKSELRAVNPANKVHMLWQIPQYIVLSAGEVMFSVTGIEFAYSQAPVSMKSVMQACFLLTNAIGNIIVIIISSLEVSEKQSHNFFLYTALMVADMVIFTILAMRYKYVNVEQN